MLIGELARRGGVSTRSLRYYEEQGLLESTRDSNDYRQYPESAALTVHRIRGLLDAGFGTEAIRTVLPCTTGPELHIQLCPDVAAEMRRIVERIDAELSSLRGRRESLAALLAAESAAAST